MVILAAEVVLARLHRAGVQVGESVIVEVRVLFLVTVLAALSVEVIVVSIVV